MPIASSPTLRAPSIIGRPRAGAKSRFRFGHLARLALAVLLTLPLVPERAAGQLFRTTEPQGAYLNLPTPPRELRLSLQEAQEAIGEQRYADAVDNLARIVGHPTMEDYFIQQEGSTGTYTSVKVMAQQILGDMPQAGRELYELRFGREAQRLLDDSVKSQDIAGITAVSRRFFHTAAGYEATMLLGRLELDRREPLAALGHFRRLAAAKPVANKLDPELPLLVAICHQQLGDGERAREELVALRDRSPAAKLVLGSQTVPLFEQDDQALTWLEQVAGPALRVTTSLVDDWRMFRGNPTRNASAISGLPLPSLRWRMPINVIGDDEPQDEQIAREHYRALVNQAVPILPAMQPLAVGNYVFLRTPQYVFGVDLTTGKRIWPWPWQDEVGVSEVNETPGNTGQAITAREERLRRAIWSDALHGQLTSDGTLVFFVYQPPHLDIPLGMAANMLVWRANGNGQYPDPRNQLVAVEIAGQGKTRWVIGGDDGDVPELSQAFFLGAPLQLGRNLYVLAEIQAEIRLLVLDSATGALKWSQQLAQLEASQIGGDDARRLAGASPSFADGVLVCPTSAGTIIAVDLSSRSLMWAYSFPVDVNKLQLQRGFTTRRAGEIDVHERWQDATVTIAGSHVLITAAESDDLHCVDLVTGKPVWNKPAPRQDSLYLATIHQETILLVGKNKLRGLKLETGQPAYDAVDLPNQTMPAGRGFVSGDDYVFPATDQHLIRFNIPGGTISSAQQLEYQLGNLICHDNQVISLGHEWMYAFYQHDKLRDIVQRRLKDNPNDAEMLEHLARIQLEENQPQEAFATLQRAMEQFPADSIHHTAAKELNVDILLALIAKDFSQFDRYRDELNKLLETPQQRREFLELAAKGLEASGRTMEAFTTYLELASLMSSVPATAIDMAENGGVISVEASRHVRPEIWIAGRLEAILQAGTGEQKSAMLDEISSLFETTQQQGDQETLERLVRLFPESEFSRDARLAVASASLEAGELIDAEFRFLTLQNTLPQDDPLAGAVAARLARLYHAQQKEVALARQLELLESRFAGASVDSNFTGKQLAEELRVAPSVERMRQLSNWPYGKVRMTSEQTRQVTSHATQSIDLLESTAAWPDGWRATFEIQHYRFALLDSFGNTRLVAPVRQTSNMNVAYNTASYHAKAIGHLVIASLSDKIIAIDTLAPPARGNSNLLWQVELTESIPISNRTMVRMQTRSVANRWTRSNMHYVSPEGHLMGLLGPVTSQGVCFQRQNMLLCLDPVSGQTLWTRRDLAPGCELVGNEEWVMAIPERSTKCRVFWMRDGTELDSREVPDAAHRILLVGPNILTWDGNYDGPNPVTLRLWNPWDQQDLWQISTTPRSKIDRVGTDELALLEPEGRYRILRLVDGSTVLDAHVEPEPKLQQIITRRSRDQYTLLTQRPQEPMQAEDGAVINIFSAARQAFGETPLIQGNVYAMDRASGTLAWATPARIDNYGFPIDQPVDAPILFFGRMQNVSPRQNQQINNVQARIATEILCLDRRTGQALLKQRIAKKYAYLADLYATPEENTATVELMGDRQWVMEFTDKPRPPAPAYADEPAIAAPSPEATGTVKPAVNIIKALGRILGNGGPEPPKP